LKRCLFAFFLFSAFTLHSERIFDKQMPDGFGFSIDLSQDTTTVDRLQQVSIVAYSPKGYRVDRVKLRAELLSYAGFGLAPFTLRSEEAETEDGQERILYTLDPEWPGTHLLTFGNVRFIHQETGEKVSLMTPVFPIVVVLPEEIKEGKGYPSKLLSLQAKLPVSISYSSRIRLIDGPNAIVARMAENEARFNARRYPFKTTFLLIACFAAFLFARWFRKRHLKEKARTERHKTARERALYLLHALHEQNLPSLQEFDAYYTALTMIIRNYLEDRYHIHAPLLTTPEFLEQMKSHPFLGKTAQEFLQLFMERADRVKFAAHRPSDVDCEDAEEAAFTFVQEF